MTRLRSLKRLLPSGTRIRTLRTGVGRGIRLNVDLRGGHIGLYLGFYEVELNKHLRRLCRPGTKSFDIGGQMGYDALVLAKLTSAEVVTVECDHDWCTVLRQNVDANPALAPMVTIHEAFVTEVSDSTRSEESLDSLVERTFVPGFVKIDIEGAELLALRGAARLLKEHRPALLVEVHSRQLEDDCARLLSGLGYSVQIVSQRRFLRDYRPTEHNRWLVAESTQ